MTTEIKILDNAGSLSDTDLELLAGTDAIQSMIRNRVLVITDKDKSCDWTTLTTHVKGLYYIRTIDESRLYQLWFESSTDLKQFKKNLTMAKMADSVYEEDK